MMKKMKLILPFIFILISFSAFSQDKKMVERTVMSNGYSSVGEEINGNDVFSVDQMMVMYSNLNPRDTLNVVFSTKVASVCEKKGCWMKVYLEDEKEVMVKFKDYAFFVPKDIQQKEVILKGKAFVTEISVEEQRHYAEDAGKTEEEINAIKKPEKTLSFLASGVKIKN